MAAGRWSVFQGMLNNHAGLERRGEPPIVLSYPAPSKCHFFLSFFSSCCLSSGGSRVFERELSGGIMSFARRSRVKMNGCPFGSKMAIIIPTCCRQIKPPKPFLIHAGLLSVSFFFCFFVFAVNAPLFYSVSPSRGRPRFLSFAYINPQTVLMMHQTWAGGGVISVTSLLSASHLNSIFCFASLT